MRRGASEEVFCSRSFRSPKTLVARGLRVDRGGRVIVSDVDFELRAGEALVVLGRNGAGKSTLLRALAGFLPLRGGAIEISGARERRPCRAGALHRPSGRIEDGADGAGKPRILVENAGWRRRFASARALQALQKVGLARIGDFPVGYLSAGQKRRVALARLFVAPRPVWLLDEPATALDVASQETLAQAMADHRAGGGMIIAATHAPLGLADARNCAGPDANENHRRAA